MNKHFHIMNVGVSIITNYIKAGKVEGRPVADNEFWNEKLNDRNFLNEIYDFVKSDPKKNSAELNSFLRIKEKYASVIHEVYLVGTNTPINEICVRTVERYLKDLGIIIYTPKEVSGYFWEANRFSPEVAREEFLEDISLLIDRLIYLANKKRLEGCKVIFNPTAGLKAHVIACAVAGFLTYSPVYYIHEEFNDIVELPPLFYLPKGREIDVLEILMDKVPKSGKDFQDLRERYFDEIERLEIYNLVEIERDRIRITNKGLHILKELKEV